VGDRDAVQRPAIGTLLDVALSLTRLGQGGVGEHGDEGVGV